MKLGVDLLSSDVLAIEVENLTVGYDGGLSLFESVSFSLREGECAAVRGESGSGKSTLLHCICGLIPRSIKADIAGSVKLFGRPVEEYRRHELAQTIGIVFQDPETQLFCDTVEDEIAFGPENIRLCREDISDRIDECLKLTGLEKYRLVSPKNLSGGQKQLVALAAVLSLRPRILLFDEAFSQLDEAGRGSLMDHVAALRDSGKTILLADHDTACLSAAEKTIYLGGGRDER